MTAYRRNRIPGGTYFFTVVLAERNKGLLIDHIDVLNAATDAELQRAPFIVAAVVLPDHLHAIWRLPLGDADYSDRWRRIKAAFSKSLPDGELISESRRSKGERGVWARRFWEHTIRDERDLQRHVDYIHFNPVKHGYVKRVADWPHSTFLEYVERGTYPLDWAGSGSDEGDSYGE